VLTPYIIREQGDLRTVFERKLQERQEFLDHYFVFSDEKEYEPPKDYSRTSGLLEDIRQSYMTVDEQRHLEEQTRPRETKTHVPGVPLELPAPIGSEVAGAGPTAPAPPAKSEGALAPATPSPAAAQPAAPAGASPLLNVTPAPRSVDKVEGR
jgi:general secretion pathway protein D